MTFHEQLRTEASNLATIAREENRLFGADLQEAERLGHDLEAKELKKKMQTNYEIIGRLQTYTPEMGGLKPDCPWCWMMSGTHSSIKAVPPPDDNQSGSIDFFRCPECSSDFELEV